MAVQQTVDVNTHRIFAAGDALIFPRHPMSPVSHLFAGNNLRFGPGIVVVKSMTLKGFVVPSPLVMESPGAIKLPRYLGN